MRAVDPTIRVIACGDNDMSWNRTVLRRAGASIDYLSIHHYYGTREMGRDILNLMAHPLHYERFYRSIETMIRELVPGKPIKLVINEWGLALPVEQAYSMDAALYTGRLMNVFERSGDLVVMTALSDLVNGWAGGIIQANRYGVFVTPNYLVNRLYAQHLGRERMATKVESPVFNSSREGRGIPYLDAVASRSADGKSVFLKAVNTDRQQALATTIRLKGVRIAPRAKLECVQSNAPGAFNSFATPDAVFINSSQIKAAEDFTVQLPRASVSVIILEVLTENQ
jgi:alpha-N-arabinofuranosidase